MVSESFLPPVVVEFAGNASGGLAAITKLVAGLDRLAASARAVVGAADAAFASLDAGATSLAAVAEAATAAKTSMQGLSRSSNAVAKATENAATAADTGMTSISAAAERMGVAVEAASTSAGTGLAALTTESRAAAVGLRASSAETAASGTAAVGAESKVKKLGSSFLGLGTVLDKMKTWGPLSLGAIGIASIDLASKFQVQMNRLVTAAGAPIAQVNAMKGAVLATAQSVGMSGTAMAEALYHPVSAGLDLAASLKVVQYAAMEAKISGASLDDTTYSLSSVMKAFNLSAADAGPTMASLNAIVGQGDMHFQDFNASVKNWAPTAAQMGISVNSMGAGLAYLTDRGNSAEVAATRLTMGVSMMTTPSAKATKMLVAMGVASTDVKASSAAMEEAMKKGGITQNQLAADLKKPDGLYVALTDLKTSLEKAGVSGTEADSVMSKIFGGGRSDKAMMSLLQNLDGVKTKFDDIVKSSSMQNFQAAWTQTTKTLSFQWGLIKSGAENLGIKIGSVLIPQVVKLLGLLEARGAPVARAIGGAFSQIASGFEGPKSVPAAVAANATGGRGHLQAGAGALDAPVVSMGGRGHLQAGAGGTGALPAPVLTPWQQVGAVLKSVAGNLQVFGAEAAKAFGQLAKAAGPTLAMLGGAGLAALKTIASILATVVGPALVKVTGFMNQHKGAVRDLIVVALIPLAIRLAALAILKPIGAIAGLAVDIVKFPFTQAKMIGSAISSGWDTTRSVWGGMRFAAVTVKDLASSGWDRVASGARTAGGAIADFGSKAGSGIATLAKTSWGGIVGGLRSVGGALKTAAAASLEFAGKAALATGAALKQAAIFVWDKTVLLATAVAEKATAAAEWLLNLAMDANPIMLVVIAIAAVVAALIYAYNHFTWFRDGVNAVMAAVVAPVMFMWHNVYEPAFKGIGAAAVWLYQNAIVPAFNGIAAAGTWLVSASVGAWHAITGGIATAMHFMSGIPGEVMGFFANAGTWLVNAGYNIMMGLWHGLESMGSWLAGQITGLIKAVVPGPVLKILGISSPSKVFHQIGQHVTAGLVNGLVSSAPDAAVASRKLATGIVDAFSGELQISSPSKKFKSLGGYVIFGLVQGLTGSTASVKAATKRISTDLYVDFGSGHSYVQSMVARDNRALLALAARRDAIGVRLKAANKNLASLQADWAKEQKSVADSIMQSSTVVMAAPTDGSTLTSFQVIAQMQDRMQKTLQFAANLQMAQKNGLSAALVQQIAAAGVDQGGATAQALSTASKGQIDQLNQLQGNMQTAANSVGGAVADSMYGAGIQAAQGLIKGLAAQQKAIEAQMLKIALSMQSAIKKALGIKSPSTVFADLGQYIPQGLAKGIKGGTHHATGAVMSMSGAVASAGGGRNLAYARGGSGGGGTTVIYNINVQVDGSVTSDAKLADRLQELMLRKGGRNSQTYQAYKR